MPIVWAYVKKYWSVFALVVAGIVGLVLLRRKDTSFSDDYRKIQEAHDQELKKIQDARSTERRELDANQHQLDKKLDQVEQQHQQQVKELDAEKQRVVDQIVVEHGNDPDALAERLAKSTGLKVIMPEDK
jgi:uncharacterized protein HemX